jgi:hypothetical protein
MNNQMNQATQTKESNLVNLEERKASLKAIQESVYPDEHYALITKEGKFLGAGASLQEAERGTSELIRDLIEVRGSLPDDLKIDEIHIWKKDDVWLDIGIHRLFGISEVTPLIAMMKHGHIIAARGNDIFVNSAKNRKKIRTFADLIPFLGRPVDSNVDNVIRMACWHPHAKGGAK